MKEMKKEETNGVENKPDSDLPEVQLVVVEKESKEDSEKSKEWKTTIVKQTIDFVCWIENSPNFRLLVGMNPYRNEAAAMFAPLGVATIENRWLIVST